MTTNRKTAVPPLSGLRETLASVHSARKRYSGIAAASVVERRTRTGDGAEG
ncbi:MAG: hypothetical protein ABIK15_07530 [Pseudomonadota bacterium]